jgi:hypothetical protein
MSRIIPRTAVRVALFVSLQAAGCADEADTFRDLPVEIDGEAIPEFMQGDPALVVGILEDGRFAPFADGQPLPVLHGVQGGRWIHLSLRVVGLWGTGGMVTVTVDRDPGTEALVSHIGAVRLTPVRQGYLEARVVQLPVSLNDAEIAAMAGESVLLSVIYDVDGRSVSASWRLVIGDD